MPTRITRRTTLALGTAALATPAIGQPRFPDRPIRLICPWPAGGSTDGQMRAFAEAASKHLGQPVVIENRPGAGGNIGARLAAKAAPDGHTLIMAPTSIFAIAMTLYRAPGYDLLVDFAPVSTVANATHVLVAHPGLAVGTLPALLERARAQPGAIAVASQGVGTVSHLEAEMLQQMAAVRFVHVPYKGSAPALVDLLAGRVPVMFDSIASALPHIRAGKVAALAVASEARSAALPGVPTVAESGLPGYRAESWLGILAPARTPVAIVERLNRELVALLAEPQMQQALVERGFEPQSCSARQYQARMRADVAQWRQVIRASGVALEE